MSVWIAIAVLLAISGLLMVIELFLVPGTTLIGILSLVLWLTAIVWAFTTVGATAGGWVLFGSVIGGASLIVYAMKKGSWTRFALKGVNKTQVQAGGAGIRALLKAGAIGEAQSALRPMGYATFHNQRIEVRTYGEYIDAGEKVRIARLDGQHIFVQQVTGEEETLPSPTVPTKNT